MEENENVKNQLTQKYFWGTHGGIGGSETTEQDAGATTLKFTIEEIKRRNMGLAIDESNVADYPDISCKEEVTALNSGFMSMFTRFTGLYVRPIQSIEAIHKSAIKRFQINSAWRPGALNNLAEQLLSLRPEFLS